MFLVVSRPGQMRRVKKTTTHSIVNKEMLGSIAARFSTLYLTGIEYITTSLNLIILVFTSSLNLLQSLSTSEKRNQFMKGRKKSA